MNENRENKTCAMKLMGTERNVCLLVFLGIAYTLVAPVVLPVGSQSMVALHLGSAATDLNSH